jgi:hypothetical protein
VSKADSSDMQVSYLDGDIYSRQFLSGQAFQYPQSARPFEHLSKMSGPQSSAQHLPPFQIHHTASLEHATAHHNLQNDAQHQQILRNIAAEVIAQRTGHRASAREIDSLVNQFGQHNGTHDGHQARQSPGYPAHLPTKLLQITNPFIVNMLRFRTTAPRQPRTTLLSQPIRRNGIRRDTATNMASTVIRRPAIKISIIDSLRLRPRRYTISNQAIILIRKGQNNRRQGAWRARPR